MHGDTYLDIVMREHEVRMRQAAKARLAASFKRAQGSPSVLKSLLTFFGLV